MNDTEHRLTRLEVRADYTDRILEERRLIVSAHSRRLADAERDIHDLSRVQMDNVERLTRVEEQSNNTSEERRDEKTARRQRRAMMQWAASIALATGAMIGLISRAEIAHLRNILSGFLSPPT
jgi:hypothetical protein